MGLLSSAEPDVIGRSVPVLTSMSMSRWRLLTTSDVPSGVIVTVVISPIGAARIFRGSPPAAGTSDQSTVFPA